MLRRSFIVHRSSAGLVGLPNVGKSTLFNAITCSSAAKTGNYDFCTIDANKGKVAVVDEHLEACAKFAGSKKIYHAEVDVVDVAGLIKGASKGAGLGNKFLADIRPVTNILHVVRCFQSERDSFDRPNPIEAIATIDAELVLADLESVEKRLAKQKRVGGGGGGASASASAAAQKDMIFDEGVFTKQVFDCLGDGVPARDISLIQPLPALPDGEKPSEARKKQERLIAQRRDALTTMQLLSAKPTIFVLNVDEDSMVNGNEFTKIVENLVGAPRCVKVCSLIEEQTAQMERPERLSFLKDGYGIEKPAVEELMRRVFELLKLQNFYTIGPNMSKAWPIRIGTLAKEAAGEIHGDFDKYFKCAKISPWNKFITAANLNAAEATKMFEVSATYEMQDGDVMLVEHNAPNRK